MACLKDLLRSKLEVEAEMAGKEAKLREVCALYAKTLWSTLEFHVKEMN